MQADSGSTRAGSEYLEERSERIRGHLALGVVQLSFGLFPAFAIVATRANGFSPWALASWRVSFGALAFAVLAFARYGKAALPKGRDLFLFWVASMLGVTANQVLYLQGVSRSSTLHAGLLMCLIPIFTFVIAALVRQERFRASRALGVLLAFAGAVFWFLFEKRAAIELHGVGDLLMVSNAFSYALYLVLSKPLTRRYPPLVVIAWVYLFALPTVPFMLSGEEVWPRAPETMTLVSFGYTLVFATVVGYLLNMFALSKLRASTTAVYIYVQPLISGLAGVFFMGDELTSAVALAGAFILAGISLVSYSSKEQ